MTVTLEAQDYLNWKANFSWGDDGLHAYRSIVTLDAVRFEMTMKGEGYLERIKELLEDG